MQRGMQLEGSWYYIASARQPRRRVEKFLNGSRAGVVPAAAAVTDFKVKESGCVVSDVRESVKGGYGLQG